MKPGDFLLGVFDIFAILLPGALATWLAIQYLPGGAIDGALTIGRHGTDSAEAPLWMAFLLSSYTLGHFVATFGARLDASYDQWRTRTKPSSRDHTYLAATALKKSLTRELDASDWTTLKWARAYIEVKAQHARVEIDRLEANQKFFRSLVIVGAVFAVHFLLHDGSLPAAVAAVVMTALSYNRFVDQRWKMTELTYGTAVIVSKVGSIAPAASAPAE